MQQCGRGCRIKKEDKGIEGRGDAANEIEQAEPILPEARLLPVHGAPSEEMRAGRTISRRRSTRPARSRMLGARSMVDAMVSTTPGVRSAGSDAGRASLRRRLGGIALRRLVDEVGVPLDPGRVLTLAHEQRDHGNAHSTRLPVRE